MRLLFLATSCSLSIAFLLACAAEPATAPEADERILPVTSGHKWTYNVKRTADGGATDCVGDKTAEVVGAGEKRDGKATLKYHPLCMDDSIADIEIQGDGDDLKAYVIAADGGAVKSTVKFLDGPVEDGHAWAYNDSDHFSWTKHDPVSVPAGKFDDCYTRRRIKPSKSSSYEVFCKGVGQVLYHASSYDAELKSKNF